MIIQSFSAPSASRARRGRTHIVLDPRSREALLVDPGADRRVIRAFLGSHEATLRLVASTRSEADGREWLEDAAESFDARLLGEPDPWPAPGAGVEDLLGGRRVRLHRAPDGRAAVIQVAGGLFTGSALLAGEIPSVGGAAQLRSRATWLRGLLGELPLRVRIYPGTGPVTEVGLERMCNQELWG